MAKLKSILNILIVYMPIFLANVSKPMIKLGAAYSNIVIDIKGFIDIGYLRGG